jgi:hypothetical protein
MKQLAKFNPHNAAEFENEMRALIVSHMGLGQGNPTQWVVNAVCEAFQRGFGVGFNVRNSQPPRAPINQVGDDVVEAEPVVKLMGWAERDDTFDPRN